MERSADLAAVFAGGGLGALCRYWLTGVTQRWIGISFPAGTMAVNIAGSFLIGFLMAAFEERFMANPALRIFLVVGVLGGFTTFSSFSYETMALVRDGELLYAASNVAGSILLCLGAAYLGTMVARAL